MKRTIKWIITSFIFIIVAGLVWSLFEANFIRIKTYEIENNDLAGLKIAFLSDFHYTNSSQEGKMKRAVRKVNQLDADFIILGGDYTAEDLDSLDSIFEILGDLEAKEGIYAVTGNHDYAPGIPLRLDELRSQYGIKTLSNKSYWLTHNGNKFKLGGVPDVSLEEADLDQTIGDTNEEDYVIFISHEPDYIMKMKDEERKKIDLMVSGHTHGGQITFFGYAPYLPSDYGQQFRSGKMTVDQTDLIISNGVGVSSIPLRFFAPAEVVVIEFTGNK